MLTTGLIALDSTIIATAVPSVVRDLGGFSQFPWLFSIYLVTQAVTVPLYGKLADTIGRRPVMFFGIAVFLVGSVLCGVAWSMPALIAFRAVQGVGAGALQPTEQAILRQTFPPQEQGMAMAVFGMAVVLGPAFGPTLGGYIVDNYSWPWIFFINIPIGIISILMVTRFVHEPDDVRAAMHTMAARQKKNLDWLGIVMLFLGLGSMQFVLEEGNRNDWFQSTEIKIIALIAVVALVALVIRELSARVPAVDLSLFKDVVFSSGTLIGAVMFAMLMAVTFLLPLFMQTLLGYSATQAGIAMMPRSLTMIVVMPIVGRLYNKVSPRATVAFGIVLFAYTAWLMGHYTLESSARDIVMVLIIQGVAFSCLFIPLTTMALSSIPRHRLSDATGLNALLRQTGGSVGLAVFATLLTRFAITSRGSMLDKVTTASPAAMERMAMLQRMMSRRGTDVMAAKTAAATMMDFQLRRQAMMLSFEKLFYLSGILFLCVLPLVFLLKMPKGSEKIDVHVEM